MPVVNATVVFVSASACICTWYIYRTLWLGCKRLPCPPGPRPRLLIGNLLDLPKGQPCLLYSEWGRQFGELTYLSVFGKTILIINSFEAAIELLDKRGHIYSDRPRMVMVGELLGLATGSAFVRYGPTWKKHRKFLKQALSPRITKTDYAPLQERKTYQYLHAILAQPENFLVDVNRLMGEVTTEIAYGAYHDEDRDFVVMNKQLEFISFKAVNGHLVEVLPWLKHVPAWFPGAKFKRDAKAYQARYFGARDYLFDVVKKRVASGTVGQPCYVSNVLIDIAQNGGDEEDERIISASSFTFYRAGSDTTESGIKTMMLAMALHPEVQAKAQEEIDRVINNRLPNVDDMDSLPYVCAIAMEALRWNPPAPIAIPHSVIEDDIYQGYFIPEGTTIIANVWGISKNEEYYPNSSIFDPERYLGDEEFLDPRDFVFGFGRRRCPAAHLAFQGIFLATAGILWSFKVTLKSERPAGPPYNPEKLFTIEATSHAVPFDCAFETRSPFVRERIREAVAGLS